jgi:hypothetical protein
LADSIICMCVFDFRQAQVMESAQRSRRKRIQQVRHAGAI